MRMPVIQGTIDRRLLVNFRIDPVVAARQLPAPFTPKLAKGWAIAGICLIRLKHIRPACALLPVVGISSENAAHRYAVQWWDDGQQKEGVYVPRRDKSSRLNAFVGGSLFPGEHDLARFDVREQGDSYEVNCRSIDGQMELNVRGSRSDAWPSDSAFTSIDDASQFFEAGSLGYSATRDAGRFDGIELRCDRWAVESLAVSAVHSSYFNDRSRFPEGSVHFDCALLMRDIAHTWHSRDDLCCVASPSAVAQPCSSPITPGTAPSPTARASTSTATRLRINSTATTARRRKRGGGKG